MDAEQRRDLVRQQSDYVSALRLAISRADLPWHRDAKVKFWMQKLEEHNRLLYS